MNMSDSKTLTASGIRYLIAIGELDNGTDGVRSKDIAAHIGVTKPSVSNMVAALQKMALVQSERFGSVFLTDVGRALAREYTECYKLLYEKLTTVLGLSERDSNAATFSILAQTPLSELPELSERLH